jgi:hypothetical protein
MVCCYQEMMVVCMPWRRDDGVYAVCSVEEVMVCMYALEGMIWRCGARPCCCNGSLVWKGPSYGVCVVLLQDQLWCCVIPMGVSPRGESPKGVSLPLVYVTHCMSPLVCSLLVCHTLGVTSGMFPQSPAFSQWRPELAATPQAIDYV